MECCPLRLPQRGREANGVHRRGALPEKARLCHFPPSGGLRGAGARGLELFLMEPYPLHLLTLSKLEEVQAGGQPFKRQLIGAYPGGDGTFSH